MTIERLLLLLSAFSVVTDVGLVDGTIIPAATPAFFVFCCCCCCSVGEEEGGGGEVVGDDDGGGGGGNFIFIPLSFPLLAVEP